MGRVASLLCIVTFMLLVACSKPLPQEKASYAGNWQAENMTLSITLDGQVSYKRVEGSVSKSINAPLKSFDGENFIVGVGPMETTFVVTSAPHQEEGVWKMTVDGVELHKMQ
jgi:hypothetical protein